MYLQSALNYCFINILILYSYSYIFHIIFLLYLYFFREPLASEDDFVQDQVFILFFYIIHISFSTYLASMR